ncbi:MAG TPA: ABC transporter permease [Erysipelotrichaceae bacterium]|nr:ABC transporter permease [Erysipelotrichaceae bacterium]
MKGYASLVKPYIFWMSLFIVVPMLLIVLYAFTEHGNALMAFRFTLDNFLRFFDPVFIKVLFKSLEVALITTFLCILIGYPIAYIISNTSERTQTLLILLITLPMWINMLVRTYAWISILSDGGILNSIFEFLGLEPIKMMYTDFAVMLGMVYNFLPFMIISIYTVLAKLDRALIHASHDLGANPVQTFLRIVLPLSMPGVISGITLVFLPAVSTFVIPKFLGGGQYMLIGNLIENQFITVGEWNFGSAISLIMAMIIMGSMILTRKIDRDASDTASVEGGKLW